MQYDTWVLAVRPERCSHCGAEHAYIFWGSYARHVRLTELPGPMKSTTCSGHAVHLSERSDASRIIIH